MLQNSNIENCATTGLWAESHFIEWLGQAILKRGNVNILLSDGQIPSPVWRSGGRMFPAEKLAGARVLALEWWKMTEVRVLEWRASFNGSVCAFIVKVKYLYSNLHVLKIHWGISKIGSGSDMIHRTLQGNELWKTSPFTHNETVQIEARGISKITQILKSRAGI